MHGRDKRVLLREYMDQGWSKTALAEKLGIGRRTIHRWIVAGQLDRDLDDEAVHYKARPPVDRKIDPYRGIIDHRLQEFPRLSSVRLFEELRAAGYPGGYTQVKHYVATVRPTEVEPVVRFETPPGHQGQVDFAHFRLPWGRRWALVVVLGYSRLMWVRFFARQTMQSLFDGLEQAFGYFGGVPREMLFDQMRSVIVDDQRLQGGSLVENLEFLRFAHHWQFRLRACRPYRAKTKGKVERPIRYLRENFFYGRRFLNDQDLDAQAARWLEEVANIRTHGTTGEQPRERFQRDEQPVLSPLSVRPYRSLVLSSTVAPCREQHHTPWVRVQQRSLELYREMVEARP